MMNQVLSVQFQDTESTERWKVSRTANDKLRGRRHLMPAEIEQLCQVIRKRSRYPDRDELMVWMAFHHGLRVSELVNLKWQHVNLKATQLAVKRLKNGIDTAHPIADKRELMLLRRYHKAQGRPTSGFVFRNERGSAVSVNGFQKMFGHISEQTLGIRWNAHALRHACGTALLDKGIDLRTIQVYMGHRNIQNTTVYLHESAKQFDRIEW